MRSIALTKRVFMNKRKRVFIILWPTLFTVSMCMGSGHSVNPEQAFYRAKLYYEKGDYDKAISENETILKQGLASGNLYYNLGNCYLAKGAIGRARLYYERARRIIPRDSALIANYNYVRSQMKQRDMHARQPMFITKLNKAFDYVTLRETFIIFGFNYYFFTLILIISFFTKRFRLFLKFVAIVFLCLTLLTLPPLMQKINDAEKDAIVVLPILDGKFEPMENAESYFPLYEGMKIKMLKTVKEWVKVERPDGKIGWVKEDGVELVEG
jgi:tetratricopeptide (TPR) repeat protein